MVDLRISILATIIYYDIFNFPLTIVEVYNYLINPKKFSGKNSEVEIEPENLIQELDKMAKAGIIEHKNGFYFLPGKKILYEERIEKDKLANRKWKKFLAIVKYLQLAPYLRAVFASGSLAANNPEPESDFDIFVIIKSGRLYTGRLFLWLISSVLGVRRRRFDIIAPDKLCFNHYLAEDNLELSHRSLYIAQSLANIKPVIGSEGVIKKFITSNRWANSYCYNFRQTEYYRSVEPNKIMSVLAIIVEFILNNFFGNFLEKIFKAIQQKRIKNNPATYESGGRILFNDKELEFHPRSFEKVVIDSYNRSLKKMDVLIEPEKDSGLN